MTPMMRLLLGSKKVYVKDSFTRANDATGLGIADKGGTWEAITGVMQVLGNLAAIKTLDTAQVMAVIDSGVANCTVTCNFATISKSTSGATRIVFRVTDFNNQMGINANIDGYALIIRVDNVVTTLGTYVCTPTSGDIIKVKMRNSDIYVYVNGSQVLMATEAFNNTATKHGLRGYAATNSQWDDFKVEAI